MLLNVIMPIYNGELLVRDTMESLLNQSYTDFRLVIVDDGSRDATLDIITAYERKDRRVKVIALENNGGIVRALNVGLENLDGDCGFIARMDCGDVCDRRRLEWQVSFLEMEHVYGLVGSNFSFFGQGENIPLGLRRWEYYSNDKVTYRQIRDHYSVMAMFAHPTIMFRRSALDNVGWYDDNYVAAEDYEIVARFLIEGHKTAKIPRSLVRCRYMPHTGISMTRGQVQAKTAIRVKCEYTLRMFLHPAGPRNVVIWGTKDFARFLASELSNSKYHLKVRAFTDFDRSAWGSSIDGLQVYPPDQVIDNLAEDDIVITIWNLEREAIIAYLEGKGLRRNERFFVFS